MCGHVGAAGRITKEDTDVLKNLFIFTSVRGAHSTGAAIMTDDGPEKMELLKAIGSPWHWLEYKKVDTWIDKYNKRMVLGHCRYATVGSICAANAHPFEFSRIVGAHNGTIPYPARNKLVGHAEYGTDSEALFRSINDNGIKETVALLDAGAWALVWYDKVTNELRFLRNKERTLYYAFKKDRSVLYWASEPGMLQLALERNGVEYDKILLLPEDTLISHAVPIKHNEIFGKAVRERVAAPKPVVTETPTIPFSHGRPITGPTTVLTADLWSVSTRRGFNGTRITRPEFLKTARDGCTWCKADINYSDHVWFVDEDECMCDECGATNGGWVDAQFSPGSPGIVRHNLTRNSGHPGVGGDIVRKFPQ